MGSCSTCWRRRYHRCAARRATTGAAVWAPTPGRRKQKCGPAQNETLFLLNVLAYEVLHAARRVMEQTTGTGWSLRRLRERVLRAASRVVGHGRRLTFRHRPARGTRLATTVGRARRARLGARLTLSSGTFDRLLSVPLPGTPVSAKPLGEPCEPSGAVNHNQRIAHRAPHPITSVDPPRLSPIRVANPLGSSIQPTLATRRE